MRLKRKSAAHATTRKDVEDNRFSFSLSAQWEDQTTFFIAGPELDGIQHNISVRIERGVEAPDIEAFSKQRIGELARGLDGFHGLSHGPVTLRGPCAAYQVVYRWAPPNQREVYQRMMFVLNGRSLYTLTVTFSEKSLKQLGAQVDRIYRSFSPACPPDRFIS